MKPETGHRQRGFTLVEVLASMAVLAILLLMLGGFFDQATKAWSSGETQVAIYDMARGALDEIYRDTTTAVADRYLPFAIRNDYVIVWDQDAQPRPKGTGLSTANAMYLGGADAVRMLTAVGPRAGGQGHSDLYDVLYYLACDQETGKGQLKRRGASIHFGTYPPNVGIRHYVEGASEGGDLASIQGLFAQPQILVPDENTDTLLDNVYAFEAMAFDENDNQIRNYFSKEEPGFRPPARVDYRLVVLSDEDWARREQILDTGGSADWHEFAEERGEVFVVRAVMLMRGRSL